MNDAHAIAVFVKTPGYSSIKTRLAATIGRTRAEYFYLASLHTLERRLLAFQSDALERGQNIQLYWAVAEKEAHEARLWRLWPKIDQSSGSLNARLNKVYSELIETHDSVTLLGADCPHFDFQILKTALLNEAKADFDLGFADDGGFYFLLGRKPIPLEAWTAIEMSTPFTGLQTEKQLSLIGKVELLPTQFDIDEEVDLLKLKEIVGASASEFPELQSYFEFM